jgi:hypothetical protein
VGLLALATVATPAAADDAARLWVLHALPGATADVWVDGERVLDDVAPGALAGPLDLPAGTVTLTVTVADASDLGSPVVGPLDVPLTTGEAATAVAHLDTDGTPTATLFPDDTSPTAAGEGRLTVRHVAAAPPVDVLVGGDVVVTGLVGSRERSLALPAGTVSTTVTANGDPVLGPVDLPVAEGTSTVAYAWGRLDGGTLALATQSIDAAPAVPPSVRAGLVTEPVGPSVPAWSYALVAMAAVLVLAAAGRTRTARRVRSRG